VLSASVTVDKQLISSVGKGILVFAAVANGDTEKDVDALAAKVLKMKLWGDEAGGRVRQTLLPILYRPLIAQQWKKSVQDIQGEILCGR
jgi:D-tyrosyl-tRNA(Tyr) deacylase